MEVIKVLEVCRGFGEFWEVKSRFESIYLGGLTSHLSK
jgi:hypothetical protein